MQKRYIAEMDWRHIPYISLLWASYDVSTVYLFVRWLAWRMDAAPKRELDNLSHRTTILEENHLTIINRSVAAEISWPDIFVRCCGLKMVICNMSKKFKSNQSRLRLWKTVGGISQKWSTLSDGKIRQIESKVVIYCYVCKRILWTE